MNMVFLFDPERSILIIKSIIDGIDCELLSIVSGDRKEIIILFVYLV